MRFPRPRWTLGAALIVIAVRSLGLSYGMRWSELRRRTERSRYHRGHAIPSQRLEEHIQAGRCILEWFPLLLIHCDCYVNDHVSFTIPVTTRDEGLALAEEARGYHERQYCMHSDSY